MFRNKEGLLEDSNQPVLLNEQEQKNGHTSAKDSILSNTKFDKNYTYFHIMGHDEPHAIRRKQILQKYPEVKILFGPDLMSAWLGVGIVLAQFWCLNFFATTNWLWYLVSSYCIGAILSHALHALMHDFTHYLCFESVEYNKLMAIFLNFGQGVPSAITFGRYNKFKDFYFYQFFNLFNRWILKQNYNSVFLIVNDIIQSSVSFRSSHVYEFT